MEHRYRQRVNSHSQVLIFERGMPVSTGVAVNSSRYGLFVETNHSVIQNQPLEIELVERSRRDKRRVAPHCRIKCIVVHSQQNGFGVEIDELNLNEFGAIAAMRSPSTEFDEISLLPSAAEL
jgi:hypothetical protein